MGSAVVFVTVGGGGAAPAAAAAVVVDATNGRDGIGTEGRCNLAVAAALTGALAVFGAMRFVSGDTGLSGADMKPLRTIDAVAAAAAAGRLFDITPSPESTLDALDHR